MEVLIKHFSGGGLSYSRITDKLKESGFRVSKATIGNVLNGVGARRKAKAQGLLSPKKKQPRSKVTSNTVWKINKWTRQENPPSQRVMANKLGLCRRTVQNVISKNLKRIIKKKTKVHTLTPKHKQNRKTNCRKLYEERLAGCRSEFMVTLDEAWFYVNDCHGVRKLCYRGINEPPPNFVYQNPEKFSERFMVVGALSGRGVLPLIRVPAKVKINSKYYIEHVLQPLIEVYLPRLYPREMDKVFIHHDAAPSHTSQETARFTTEMLSKWGITVINKNEIPVKSPDTSPMDFYGFGVLKQRLHLRRATTQEGLWKVLNDEWNSISPTELQDVFEAWKRRLRMVAVGSGEHIEQTKQIHRRKL